MVPTIAQMTKVYVESARIERLKGGSPGEGTVANTLGGVRSFVRWLNESRERLDCVRARGAIATPCTAIITNTLLRKYLSEQLERGIKPITAVTHLNQLRGLFARWVRPYYEDLSWQVPVFPAIIGHCKVARYQRPAPELLEKVKTWYVNLTVGPLWFVATMMLEFAMRNSDVLRLRRENFIVREGGRYLNYTPHKTENSSGRMVKWPVHPELWDKMRRAAPGEEFEIPDYDAYTFRELNRQMRALGFTGTKGVYELRKICIDHVYQRYGAEMAVSISGDDIKTITRYYADPAQPNIGATRIIDLL